MHNKYGEFPNSQVSKYLNKLHSMIHWLLIYKDEKNPMLDHYFDVVQFKLIGLNELFNYPEEIVEIMQLIESARVEYGKEECNSELFRTAVLDAHALVDRIVKDGD